MNSHTINLRKRRIQERKKIFALKVADNFEDDTDWSDSKKEDELTLIIREFRKILRRREKFKRRKFLNKVDRNKKKEKEKDQ